MLRIKFFISILLFSLLLSSCDFISNTFTYKNTAKEFVDALLKNNFDKCIDLMAWQDETAKNENIDALKARLLTFKALIVENFGTDLDYSLAKAEKTFSIDASENNPPNTTIVFIEFHNKMELGMLKIVFDDTTKKIMNIDILDIKKPIPSMTIFWLFGLLAICIPLFNIYVIRLIKRSDLEKKWIKYIAVIVLNVPSIAYQATSGLSFLFLNIQLLFGISFEFMGYLGSAWTFGIPLGGLYWFIKLKQRNSLAQKQPIAPVSSL